MRRTYASHNSQIIRMLCGALLAAAASSLGALAARAQQTGEPDTLQVQSTAVVVDVIVTDRKGHPAPGLAQSAFKVYEDNVEQTIAAFTDPPAVSSSVDSTEVTAAVTPEAIPASAKVEQAPSQFITVVLDLADNQAANLKRSCDAVVRYLQKTKTADTAVAIYSLGSGLQLALPFTQDMHEAEQRLDDLSRHVARGNLTSSDRTLVQDQINDLYARANPESQYGAITAGTESTPAADARRGPADAFVGAYKREIESLRSYLSTQNTFQARSVFVALRALALSYLDLPGRKNIVLFSEGFGSTGDVRTQLEGVVEAANRANASFYIIDSAGLDTRLGITSRSGSTRAAQMTEIAQEGIGQRGGESKFDRIRAIGSELDTHSQLGELADATGGLLIKNTNDLGPAFEKVIEDSRNFYTLVYYPTNKKSEGSFRKIKVTLASDGYRVRHRQGYWAIPRAAGVAMTPLQAHIFSSSRGGSLKSAFEPAVKIDVALAADGKYYAPLSVAVPAGSLPAEKDLASGKGGLVLVAFAYDLKGNLVSTYERHWDAARPAKFEKSATVTMQGQMVLPQIQPVRVQVVVQLPNGSFAIGGDEAQLPSGAGPNPLLTSLFLTDQIESATCEDKSEALCVQNIRLRQPAKLEFTRPAKLLAFMASDELSVDPETKQPRVGAEFTVRSGEKVLGAVPAQNVQAFPGPRPGSVMFVAQLNLSALPPGSYTLEAKAHDLVRKTSSEQKTDFHLQ